MARRKAGEAVSLESAQELTAGLIAALKCPAGKAQAFLRDTKAPGLRVRVTANGAKAFVFETKVNGKTLRRTIGSPVAWTIEAARIEANRLRVLTDTKTDPRELERQQAAQRAAELAAEQVRAQEQAAQQQAESVTVGSAWARYVVEGSPKRRDAWKPRYVADMAKMVAPGGEPKKRGAGLTMPGHLFPLLAWRLVDVNEDSLAAWFKTESRRSKHQATRALMMFRGFLRWCAAVPEYRALVDRDAGKAPAIMDNLPETKRRTDALEAAQVAGWWTAVEQLPNPIASAYLRALLLTGARREEMAALRWDAVDFRWRKLTIADKVGDTRTFPLSDYMAHLLASLPRRMGADGKPSPFVFASVSKSGRIADPRASHDRALSEAGIAALTLHGLRRSFSLLGEAAGAPAGAIAQVMGHRPSATAEGYRPRSVDALRPFLQRIEAHILSLAGVTFDATATLNRPRLVKTA
ncbi:integrase family protein [Ideonella alba]|uniref:integrase family protein n=1 Tax=Ideonella alba TaxID=2824118 RepID=UPI00287391B1|nr:integrase family protein [Ideonella alba]